MDTIWGNAKRILSLWGPPSPGELPRCKYRGGADLDGDPIGCDCSAFAARCCGQRKFDPKTGFWWGTDRIYDDALKGHARWRKIDAPRPGCIGVYPAKMVAGKRVSGHVWVVDDPAKRTTIECSSSGKGIAGRRRPAWFKPGATGNGKPIIWAEFVGETA